MQELAGTGSNTAVKANLLTGGTDELFSRSVAGATPAWSWALPDANNNTVMLTDKLGAITQTYAYEPYGKTTATGGANNSQQYTGRENDETGLYFYRNRYYMPGCMRFISEDPIGWASGQTNNYAYVGGDPISLADPFGLFSAADLPSLPSGLVDFAGGFGDTLSFGATGLARSGLDIGSVDKCSGAYSGGGVAGIAWGIAMGGATGLRAAGVRGPGREFSHWIPNRMGGPRSLWNGNYVSAMFHVMSDPYRYRFMPRAWKETNPMPNSVMQQLMRLPWVYVGGAVGGAVMGVSMAAQSGGCD